MKPHRPAKMDAAMTLTEVVVVVFVLAVLVVIILPMLARTRHRYNMTNCMSNLKQIGLSFREWAGDNGGKFPMQVSMANGGTRELAAKGDVVATFQIMSNELCTPKILVCAMVAEQLESSKRFAADFSSDLKYHISYFIGLDAGTNSPQAFLSGDDNFETGGVPVKSGLQLFSTNAPIAWTAARHHFAGFLLFADGSVQWPSNSDLVFEFQQTGLATNRLAIP